MQGGGPAWPAGVIVTSLLAVLPQGTMTREVPLRGARMGAVGVRLWAGAQVASDPMVIDPAHVPAGPAGAGRPPQVVGKTSQVAERG